MPKIRDIHSLIKQYSLANCLWRAWYDRGRRSGALKAKFPAWQWGDRTLAHWLSDERLWDETAYLEHRRKNAPAFFFAPGKMPRSALAATADATGEADGVLAGRFRYFSAQEGTLGFPPDWMANPFTGQHDSIDKHWCDRGDFDPARGDIKWYWEQARFGWAFAMVRAYAATGDEKYPEGFWRVLESFMSANPPQMGPNWQCGQETALRAMACTFAAYAFVHSPATTPARLTALAKMLAFSGDRIEGNIAYAVSTRTNHAASEAAGLLTLGLVLPELASAQRWRELGMKHLCREARMHNWPDGSYVQHSLNYQRLMLHDYIWAVRLAELNGVLFPADVREKIAASVAFMYQLQDADSGRLPNYGNNDGARILPLSDCDYGDYRPVIGAAHYLFEHQRLYDEGPWQDDLVWLFGQEAAGAARASVPRASAGFATGGYYTLRGADSWAMVRCHSYRSRPAQADVLHLDLWWKGVNILRDSGTFAYYDPPADWGRYFASTRAHNTVTLGGVDQMEKGARFRWYTLAQANVAMHRRLPAASRVYWQGEHYGYRRLASGATHRRAVAMIGPNLWCVVDDIIGSGSEAAELWWHLPDVPCVLNDATVSMTTPHGEAHLTVLADKTAKYRLWHGVDEPGGRGGWQSLSYGQRTPAYALSVTTTATLPVRFFTLLSLGQGVQAEADSSAANFKWRLADGTAGSARLSPPGEGVMIEVLQAGEREWKIATEGEDIRPHL